MVLLVSAAAGAQVVVGEDLKMNLNGSLGFGYGGGWGSFEGSNHSLNFNGNGTLSGSYYSPNFLSFTFQPYYNRSQNNSDTQSIVNSTGLLGTVNLFSGSKFPGWVSFNKTFDGSSEFGLPGVTGLTTEGSTQSFSIGWSALLPKWPTLSANFTTSSSASTVVGTTGETDTSSKNFNLISTYTLSGFHLLGYFNHQTMGLTIPVFLGFGSESSNTTTSYGLSANHSLPLSGSFWAGWNRSSYSTEGVGITDGVTNNFDTGVVINPTRKLTLSGEMRYIGNVLGALQESVLSGGGGPLLPVDNTSHSLSFGTTATYALGRGLSVRGFATHLRQYYYGQDVSQMLYGGTLNFSYARPLFGTLNFSFGLVDNANQFSGVGSNTMGMVANVGMNRRFRGWDTSADFSYAQNVQTLLAAYTTSSYTYGGYIRRRLNTNTYWNGSFRGAHSALTHEAGEGNGSYSFTTGLTWRKYGVTGGYSMSSGTTVLGPSGLLTPTPVPGLLTDNIVLFDGHSYTLSVFMTPIKRMTIYATYANASSDTLSKEVLSLNRTAMLNSRLEYRLRKLTVIGGFTRYEQGISASGILPSVVNSYSIGISRWFNVF